MDLSIKRATEDQDSDSGRCSSSQDSNYENDGQVEEEIVRPEDLLLQTTNINGKSGQSMSTFVNVCDLIELISPLETHLKSRNTPVLWQFLLMCLGDPHLNPSLIEWVSKETGTFRLTNVNSLASLWGQIKKRPRMNGDHFKRSLR